MTTHLVTFSDESMSRSRDLCEQSALRNGIDVVHVWADYQVWANWDYFTIKRRKQRGCGFWVWKPWIIREALDYAQLGDIVVYADAGVEFIAPVSHIINRMDQDIFLFGNNWEHAHWCKRDVIDEIWPYDIERDGPIVMDYLARTDEQWDRYYAEAASLNPWQRFGKQVQASVIFFRISDYAREFVAEWLKWCLFEGERLIDDSPSRLPNHPEFREHRHDQAILTTLAHREGIKLHYWPAMYNDGAFVYEKLPEYVADDYPILFHHHRRRNHE